METTTQDEEMASDLSKSRKAFCWVDNSAVVYIFKAMVTASRKIILEVRLFRGFMEREGLELDIRWIYSAENRYADRQSRAWAPSAPQCTCAVTALFSQFAEQFLPERNAVLILNERGENLVAQRNKAEAAMAEWWGEGRALFFNPPPELLGVTLTKMEREKARGKFVVPFRTETSSVPRCAVWRTR